MKFICSLVVVEDIIKSRDFYERILDQKVVTDFGENIAFQGGFAIHQKDHFVNLIGDKAVHGGSNSFELYFEDDNIEGISEKLKKENIEFIHEITEQPWRQRVIRFYDYDRNIIEIGESMEYVAYRLYMENATVDEIIKITYLRKETVENAITRYSGHPPQSAD